MMRTIPRCLISSILIAVFVTACVDNGERPGACVDEEIRIKLEDWLAGIRDYQSETVVEMGDQRLHSTIVGRVPDRLSIRLVPESKEEVTWRAVFDGDYQWVELKSGDSVDVFKIELKPVVDKQRPFDTSYYIMGSGLMNGEDFPTSIRSLLSTYDLSVSCAKSGITLAGPVNKEKFKSYAKGRRSPQSDKVIDKFFEQFGFLVMTLDAESYQVKGYRFGAEKAASDQVSEKASQYKVEFTDMQVNKGIDSGVFDYAPPPGVIPSDITDQIRLQN